MKILATGLQVVDRARSATSQSIGYALGLGGMRPELETPGALCDCSGFAAWCNFVSRYIERWNPLYEGGDWFETTALARDAKSPFGFVDLVPERLARPGMLYVYGDRGPGKQGHVGVVSAIEADRGPSRVIHCSRGNEKAYGKGHAVHETGPDVFRAGGAIVARLAFIDYGG